MEWGKTEKMLGGAKGFYQRSEKPGGYYVTFTVARDGVGVFTASSRDNVIGHAYVDPQRKELVREMGRAMRAMCGLFDSVTGGRK